LVNYTTELPEVPQVNCCGLLYGQVLDVESRIATFADTILGLSTGVGWVIDVAAFVL
jgi:hypothetical protein